MQTRAAQRTFAVPGNGTVQTRAQLRGQGVTDSQLRARLAAGRWQRCGRAIILHNGPLTRQQRWAAALISVGPRATLTSFTAAELLGLTGWAREEIHILVPMGARSGAASGLVRLHRSRSWEPGRQVVGIPCHAAPPALIMAASGLPSARWACGLLAAGIQQRLTSAAALRRQLQTRDRTRHRRQLLAALHDIEGGSQALSEIDFVRLCLRYGLPAPVQQAIRRESTGRRRYLDATWRREDGRLVVVEVDGALHLEARTWWNDQLRQNDIALGGALVLRFPSAVIRDQPDLVAQQLRRALDLPAPI
jgi:hypothetical protein